jgi:PAS domain S-box-containing protein
LCDICLSKATNTLKCQILIILICYSYDNILVQILVQRDTQREIYMQQSQSDKMLEVDYQAMQQELQQLRHNLQQLTEENSQLQIASAKLQAQIFLQAQSCEQKTTNQELAAKNKQLEREIQERKRVEEVQRNSLLLRQTLLNSIPNPIFFKNDMGMFLGCNHAFEQYIGLSESEIVGHTAHEIYSAEMAIAEEQRDTSILNSNSDKVHVFEQRISCADGRLRDVVFNITTFKVSDGSIAGLVGIIIDISEHKRAEEVLMKAKETAEDANRIKSQFIANMSHELRTPLNAILGYSEMLEEDIADLGENHLIADVRKINAAGKHLLGLINDVLDISKIEAGRMTIYTETFAINDMVNEVTNTIRPIMQTKNNILHVQQMPEIGNMHSDLTKIRQILFNLLSNAAKFTEHGRIQLQVERQAQPDLDWIIFTIIDEGIGMTREQISKLFQPFTQADASTTRKYGGTGLGLTISKRFAEMLGGDIQVKSHYGLGSTFTVKLPAYNIKQEEVIAGSNLPDATDNKLGDTVLIIDDDPIVCELLQNYINKLGFQVIIAKNGKEGLRLAKLRKPHAITLDVMMPGMDGWMVLSELKNDPELAKIPVIMLSLIEDKSIGYSLGAAEYLTKPINRDELNRVLRKYLTDEVNLQKILVVEDDDVTRNLIKTMLQKVGWQVELSENGKSALRHLLHSRPDLILSDLMMPEMDGFELIEKIRKEPSLRKIPVVVLTAKDMSNEERNLLNQRVEKIFQKGDYRREELLNEIRECLSKIKPK